MSKTITLSPETLSILKTISTINNSLAFKAGSVLKTVNESGTIIFDAEVAESFPIDFNVYELNKFLSILSLHAFKDAELVFEDGVDTHMIIRSTNTAANIKFFFSRAEFTKHPGKDINLPHADVKFLLQQAVLDDFQKTASILGHKCIEIRVQNKRLSLIAGGSDLEGSNDFTLDLGENEAEDFSAKIKLENLKLVQGDYQVSMLRKDKRGISEFKHTTRKITTFIALELFDN